MMSYQLYILREVLLHLNSSTINGIQTTIILSAVRICISHRKQYGQVIQIIYQWRFWLDQEDKLIIGQSQQQTIQMKPKKGTKGTKNNNTKSQAKRLKTFNSSEFSLLSDKQQHSVLDFRIFKNEIIANRKDKSHSALSQYTSSKPQAKTTLIKRKKNKSKPKLKIKKQEQYEHCKLEDISNPSDIIFSNEETKRTSQVLVYGKGDNQQKIQILENYRIDENKMLRMTIRKEYQRKVQAATKIQKVFRGYMTRKILMKYIKTEEQKILKQLFNQSGKHSQNNDFQENNDDSHEGTFRDAATHQIQSDYDKFNHTIRPRIQFLEGHEEEKSSSSSQNSQSQESDQYGYRHKQPVYSHEEISKFLEESSEELEDVYQPDIIFETNDEYIDSRKSSLQNKNQPINKLSKHSIKDENFLKHNQVEQLKEIQEKSEKIQNILSLQKQQTVHQENKFQHSQYSQRSLSHMEASEIQESIFRLKEDERGKWDEIIQMINGQIQMNKQSNGEFIAMMKKILEMSQKNKQFLDSTQSVNLEGAKDMNQILRNHQKEFQKNEESQLKLFKKKNLFIDIPKAQAQLLAVQSKDDYDDQPLISESCPIVRKENFHLELEKKMKEKELVFDHTGKLKAYISSNLQDDTISEMLKIRQELLEKRESEELFKLNRMLSNRELTQQQFLTKLQNLTKKFKHQKQTIDKARQDIQKGYRAAMNLMRQSFYDAKRLGFKLSMSRSQDNLKYKHPKNLINGIIVDEVTPKSTKKTMKQIFMEDEKDQSENNSSVQFTEEELNRFRKIQTNQFNELSYMNQNVVISQDFFKQQNENPNDMKINLQREIYHFDDQIKSTKQDKQQLTLIIEKQLEELVLEFASQIIIKPNITEKFIDRSKTIRPAEITSDQRERFIQIIQGNLPPNKFLISKLNQKITPLPSQILKCMRLDFSEDIEEEEQNYEEVSKYQFVIGQEVCAKSVMMFKSQLEASEERQIEQEGQQIISMKKQIQEGNFSDQLKKFIIQRDKFLKNRKQHAKDLLWEVLNIEIHCIFDAWNEEIIQIKSQKSGFSGIGLNELTLSLIDHNKNVRADKVQQVIAQSKEALLQTLDPETEVNAKILKENFKQMCYNDSAWIFYADEALSYGLELVYLIEQDLYKEMERDLKKIIMKNLFN